MKRTQVKDALRNIGKQKVSYLSIVLIAFLGVMTFLGIDYSAAALRRNGSAMYNKANYRDIEIGFTLKAAVQGSLDNQYSKIVAFDEQVKFDADTAEGAEAEIERQLRSAEADYTKLYDTYITYRVVDNEAGELLCGDIDGIREMFHLLDWKTGEPLASTDDGILIRKRLAESYDLDIGSEFEIAVGGTKTVMVRVAGIFDNYIGRRMLMSPAYYEEILGEACEPNMFLVRLNGADEDGLEENLRRIEGYESIKPSDTDKAMFEASTSVIDAIVLLFIFIAAIMAGVVLLNLTNIYILQKKSELTIMRVNGFTVREVIDYVIRETVVTTVLGILLWIAMGSGIAYRIVRSMEQSFIQFERSVCIPAWLIGAAVTVVFTVLVNAVALRKVRTLKLTDMT